MSVTVLVKNSCSTVGEGPHWEEKTKTLLYIDIEIGEIHKYNTTTGEDIKIKLDDRVGCAVPRASGGYVVGLGRHLVALDWETRAVKSLVEVEHGKHTRWNDGKCDPSGRLWAGTMGLKNEAGEHPPGLASLYSLDKDGSIKLHHSPVSISNGLAWSSDTRTMFYIDSTPRQLYAFDFDDQAGTISNKRVVTDFSDKPMEGYGVPDGMCIDVNDKLWVAGFLGEGVFNIDPETGSILRKVDVPASRITSCCFGGSNYDELFVTSSAFELTKQEQEKFPLAGSVFKVTGLGTKGLQAPDFLG